MEGDRVNKQEAWENLMITIDDSLSCMTYEQLERCADEMKRLAAIIKPLSDSEVQNEEER